MFCFPRKNQYICTLTAILELFISSKSKQQTRHFDKKVGFFSQFNFCHIKKKPIMVCLFITFSRLFVLKTSIFQTTNNNKENKLLSETTGLR